MFFLIKFDSALLCTNSLKLNDHIACVFPLGTQEMAKIIRLLSFE